MAGLKTGLAVPPQPVSPRGGAGVSATPTDTVGRRGGSKGCGFWRARRPNRARLDRDSVVEVSVALGGVLRGAPEGDSSTRPERTVL